MSCEGKAIVELCKSKIGQEYFYGADVPLNDLNWKGPWDCAELCSWGVYQACSIIYGCTDNKVEPENGEAYTGSWKKDMRSLGKEITVHEALKIPGAMLLKRSSSSGHIAVSIGDGGSTVEAKGRIYGVVQDSAHGRTWNHGVLVPSIQYTKSTADKLNSSYPDYILPQNLQNIAAVNSSGHNLEMITFVQNKLLEMGYLVEEDISGVYDELTEAVIRDLQIRNGITPHGELDSDTSSLLHLDHNEIQSAIQFEM